MNDYEVRFVYDLVSMVTYVAADDEVDAQKFAEQQVYDETGFGVTKAKVWVTKVGEFLV